MPGPKAPQETRREQIINAAHAVALRDGIDGVTLRAVAAEAGLSHGLVLFHFKQKEQLVAALLDRVLTTTTLRQPPADVIALPSGHARMSTLLRYEMDELVSDPRRMRLFLEYWALGARDQRVRGKIGAALQRYRATFRSLTEEARPTDSRQASASADALAAVAVSLVSGFAVQAMVDPDHFDADAYRRAIADIVDGLVPSPVRQRGAAARRRSTARPRRPE